MKIEDFNYNLPENLIAQHPIYPRDYAKLMVLNRKDKSICHRRFYDIIQYLSKGDVLVLNDTRVIRARVKGLKEGTKGKREVFLLSYLGDFRWKALVSPAKRTHKGDRILIDKDSRIYVEIEERGVSGENVVRFETHGLSMEEILKTVGNIPLPPYIKGKIVNEEEYQTVFSEKDGAVAAPTAGLHFTEDLLEKVKEKGVKVVYITLHVGLGTFRPVKETIEKHKMHREEFFISEETARIINESKMAGGKVFACGTTTVRALETAATFNGVLKPMKGKTRLFIKPGYPFKVVDAIITNFHFPRTTLLMLVAAFAGKDFILDAYNVAVKECYRFYSFGDAMLIIYRRG